MRIDKSSAVALATAGEKVDPADVEAFVAEGAKAYREAGDSAMAIAAYTTHVAVETGLIGRGSKPGRETLAAYGARFRNTKGTVIHQTTVSLWRRLARAAFVADVPVDSDTFRALAHEALGIEKRVGAVIDSEKPTAKAIDAIVKKVQAEKVRDAKAKAAKKKSDKRGARPNDGTEGDDTPETSEAATPVQAAMHAIGIIRDAYKGMTRDEWSGVESAIDALREEAVKHFMTASELAQQETRRTRKGA